MKKGKKLVSLLLTLVMVMSFSVSVFAANPTVGTLKVHGNELGGKNVTAVLMFTANVLSEDDLIGEGDSVGYELVDAWQNFMKTKLNKETVTSEEAYNYVKELNGDVLLTFSEDAKDYAKQNNLDAVVEEANEATDTALFTNLPAGYYVVYPDAGSTSVVRGTEAMIVNVPSSKSAALELKSEYPTVDKVVDANGDNNFNEDESAEIGDTVKFQLSSLVPEMSDYSTYEFNFVDTMSAGLTYVENSAVVTIKGNVVTPSRVTYENNVLRVEFDDLKTVDGISAGDAIFVTYDAIVNENAVIGANTNSAKVEYSNDPNWTYDPENPSEPPTGESDEDTADVYTFEITVDKYAMINGVNTKLSGAVFTLKDTNGNVINLVLEDETNNVYRLAKDEESNTVTQVTTNEGGAVKIEGLKEGTYYLEEVAAPTGYNKLAEDVKIVISADYSGDTVVVEYQVGNADASASSSIPVENKTGTVLPETGGMGTIALTALGVAVVVMGSTMPKRKNAKR